MFDRIDRSNRSVNFPGTIEVTKHEHRAPTDESVRLLREMEKKAREQVALAMVTDNTLSACAVHFGARGLSMDTVIAFKLNGEEYVVRPRGFDLVMRKAQCSGDIGEIAKAIATAVADAIMPALVEKASVP